MINKNKNHKSRISLWLDENLVKILKNKKYQANLNEELQQFLKCQNSCIDVEVTLDSYPEVQNMIKLLSKLDNEATKLLKYLDLCIQPLIDIGTDIFYDNEDDYDNEDEDNSCDRLSAYYGAFNERPEEIKKMKEEDELYNSLQENSFTKKIAQIKKFYHLNDTELDKCNKKQLIKYLLTRVDSNKNIVDFLHYKNVRNQLGKPYTKESIAKKRYILKKFSTFK